MTHERFLKPFQRQLTGAEKRLLGARSRSFSHRARRVGLAGLLTGAIATMVLWGLTALASDAPIILITGFWVVVGGAITFWVHREIAGERKTSALLSESLASALRRNLADVYPIQSSRFVEFEEIEDEGACYAFQLEGRNEIVIISGQEFYTEARFPSLDFALVFPLDEVGNRVDMLIEKRGPKAAPDKTIPATIKSALNFPEDLEIIEGSLDDIEVLLGKIRAR